MDQWYLFAYKYGNFVLSDAIITSISTKIPTFSPTFFVAAKLTF